MQPYAAGFDFWVGNLGYKANNTTIADGDIKVQTNYRRRVE